jgi:hypothetical protein
MENAESLRDHLFNDHFESHWCVACGGTGALYAIPPGEFVGACSRCLIERIENLRRRNANLPEWVSVLEQEAKRQVAVESREDANEFALDFDDLYRCSRCDKLIHQRDARYPIQLAAAIGGVGPHCLDCYAAVTAAPSNEL